MTFCRKLSPARIRAIGLRLLASVSIPLCVGCATTSGGSERSMAGRGHTNPDVLFIAIDDLNDWTGFLGGHPQAYTPNLDELASRGMVFTRAYCAAPVCNPSRGAVMTGMRPSTTGMYTNRHHYEYSGLDVPLLPAWFKQHGYKTLRAGKVEAGNKSKANWNQVFSRPPEPDIEKILPEIPGELDINVRLAWGPLPVRDEMMSDYSVAGWTMMRLREPIGHPQFLACGIVKPHLPWQVPTRYFNRIQAGNLVLPTNPRGDEEDLPRGATELAQDYGFAEMLARPEIARAAIEGYLASVAFMDAQIGRITKSLDKWGRADNTVVVIWSDNGFQFGQKGHWKKESLWEPATRVPLIIIAPGITTPGSRSDSPVSLIDLYPTLAELSGLPKPAHVEGESLVPILKNPARRRARPVVTSWGPDRHAVRSDRWRYIAYDGAGEELYDMWSDPHEWHNLANTPGFGDIKREHAQYLPRNPATPIRNAPRDRGSS